jgi:hypothetical protein
MTSIALDLSFRKEEEKRIKKSSLQDVGFVFINRILCYEYLFYISLARTGPPCRLINDYR